MEKGAYHPRIARPYSSDPADSPGTNPEDEAESVRNEKTEILIESAGQLHHLKEHLEEISRVVRPHPNNFSAFGHEIRNVFIIACTEVEAQWHGVMKANGYDGFDQRHGDDVGSTNDYVELLKPLKLDQYLVKFPYFPSIEPISPFEHWTREKPGPTQSLEWYAAYNKVKHDREKHFEQAHLKHAFHAAAAYFVMLCAQHGWELAARPKLAATRFFQLKKAPTWDEDECYTPDETTDGGRVFDKVKKLFAKTNPIESRPPLIIERKIVEQKQANLVPEVLFQ
jgi:hypothetical protein